MALPNATQTRGTSTNLASTMFPGPVEKQKTPQEECRANGGIWDAVTQTCILIPKADKKVEKPQPTGSYDETRGGFVSDNGQFFPTSNKEFVPGQTGKPDSKVIFNKDSSITANGKTMTRDEYKQMLQNQPYTDEVNTFKQQELEREMKQDAIAGLGFNQAQIAAIEAGVVETPIDIGQALTAGVANVIPSAAGGAAVGAAGGAFAGGIGAVPGAIIGGVAGLVGSLFVGVKSNIAKQQKGEINAAQDVLRDAKSNMRKLSSLAAKDPKNVAQYTEAYNQQLAQVYRARAKVKLETQGNLNKFMEDGTDILSDFDLFLQDGGQADIYRRQLELSIISGVPPDLTIEDFE